MRKQRPLSVISLLLACLILISAVTPVRAEASSVRELAQACFESIRSGESTAEAKVQCDDAEALLDELFQTYPVLCHYYSGGSWTQYPGHINIVLKLHNIDDPLDSIPVITYREELMAVVGLSLLKLQEQISFVVAQGFDLETELPGVLEELRSRYYLAYMGYRSYSYESISCSGILDIDLTLKYYEGVGLPELRQWRSETEEALLELSGTLFAADMPDAEILLRIHDWIVNNTRYHSENMDDPGNYMAYGCLVRGLCVCQGYAEAFRLLCQAAGIDARYVTGTGVTEDGEESHGWNAVLLDGEWYMVDTTWDDPISSTGGDILRYDYFLVTGDQLSADHNWDVQAYPICDGSAWDADRVLEQFSQTGQQYTQYKTDGVMTMGRTEEELSRALPGGQTPPETEPSTEPSAAPTTPAQQPQPPQPQPVQPQEQTREPSLLWILLVIVLVLLVAGAGLILLQRSRRPRRRRRVMDPPTWESPRGSVRSQSRGGSSGLPGSEW